MCNLYPGQHRERERERDAHVVTAAYCNIFTFQTFTLYLH